MEPPPPPPPPPPASRPEDEERAAAKRRRADMREVLALFHSEEAGAQTGVWAELWAAALADAQDEQRRQRVERKRRKRPGERSPPLPPARRPGAMGVDAKRARQAGTEEPSKLGRAGRFQAKGAGGLKGSKLLQKLGGGSRS